METILMVVTVCLLIQAVLGWVLYYLERKRKTLLARAAMLWLRSCEKERVELYGFLEGLTILLTTGRLPESTHYNTGRH